MQPRVGGGVTRGQDVGDCGERGVELGVGDDRHGLVGRVGCRLRQRVGGAARQQGGGGQREHARAQQGAARRRVVRGPVLTAAPPRDGCRVRARRRWSRRCGRRRVRCRSRCVDVGSAVAGGAAAVARRTAQQQRASPTAASRSRIPRTIRGVLHGVATATGQVRVSCCGAFVPSPAATSRNRPGRSSQVRVTSSSPDSLSSHMTEPARVGHGGLAVGDVGAERVGVGQAGDRGVGGGADPGLGVLLAHPRQVQGAVAGEGRGDRSGPHLHHARAR